ncbi:MAG: FtsX-like permease family protein [Bacteroidales bacterium]
MNINLHIAKKIGSKLGSNKKRISSISNLIAIISIAISMFVIVIAVVISDGFKKEISDKVSGFSGELNLMYPGTRIGEVKYPIDKRFDYLDDIKNIDGVTSINGVAYVPGMLQTSLEVQAVFFKGVDSFYDMSFFEKHLVKGHIPNLSTEKSSKEILISKRLAKMLNFDIGDKIYAYFVSDQVKARRFIISGIYSIQLEQIDKTLVVTDIRQVQQLNKWSKNQVSNIEIRLDDQISDNERDEIKSQIDNLIISSSDENSDVVLTDIHKTYAHLFDWLGLLDFNVGAILLLMIIVAGFNMVSSLLIILFEKISMIGLLKSLGMRDRSIRHIFIYRGGSLLVKGMLIGDAIAIVFSIVQYYFEILKLNPVNYFVDHVPIYFNVSSFLLLNGLAFIIIMLILIIPSQYIARVSPEKTMRVK